MRCITRRMSFPASAALRAEVEIDTALTIKKIYNKNLPFFREMRDNRITIQLFFRKLQKGREVFTKKTKEKVTRAEARKQLTQFHLSCELLKVIRRFFPELLSLLKQI